MNPPPTISVVIPVFNSGSTLEQTVLSVIKQDYAQREIILVDGGSTDQSTTIIQQYRKWLDHLVIEPDHGVYDAMNKGIKLAKGEWFYFLGADDFLADESVFSRFFVETEVNAGVKILYGSVLNMDVTNQLVPTLHTSSFGKKLYWKNTLHHQSAFYHRSLFDTGYFDTRFRILADYDFHLGCLDQKASAQFVPRLVAKCRAGGLSKNFKWSLYREELRIKWKRLPVLYYLLNIPWVIFKYCAKNLAGKRS